MVNLICAAIVIPAAAALRVPIGPVMQQSGFLSGVSTRLKANPESPPVIVTGAASGNLVFGKLQRAAQLPGSRLSPTPLAAVSDRGRLSSVLWSSFAMASVASGGWLDRKELLGTYALEGALLFVDCTSDEAGGGGLFGGFKPKVAAPPKATAPPKPKSDEASVASRSGRNWR